VKVAELFEGVDKRPQSMIQFGAKVAAEQLRKMGLSVRIDTRVIGKHEKSDRTVMTVAGDIEEAEILKVLKKNKVEYATVGSTTKDGKKSRMIRLVTPPIREDRLDELSVDTLASYRSKRLKQRSEVFAKDPYATPKGPKDPLSDKVHTGVHRAYRKELHGKSVEANKKDPGRGSIQRQYYSGESGSRSGD
jgi:hypothetical protein